MSIKVHFLILYVLVVIQSCCYATTPIVYQNSLRNRHPISSSISSPTSINVDDFINKSDEDHTKALNDAWSKACATKDASLVLVPKGSVYHVKQLTFSGPCVSPINVHIYGTIVASNDMSRYEDDRDRWIVFKKVKDLTVSGGGTVDGNGAVWWETSCKTDRSRPCKDAPTAMTFSDCTNLVVDDIKYINAQQMHLRFDQCENVTASDVVITSPGHSPNTDGIHVSGSNNVRIQRPTIGTGDDCISIVSGSTNVNMTDVICGPGHGISIGSLGEDHSKAIVSNVFVKGATLTGTTNGLRIKSWQGGYGYAKGITFQNVAMTNVSNPIIIDQNYCDKTTSCHEQSSAVRVNNVVYNNITGTSHTNVAIKFECSENIPCQQIVLQDVKLGMHKGQKTKAVCNNISVKRVGFVYPRC